MIDSKTILGLIVVSSLTSCIFCSDRFFEFSNKDKEILINQRERSRFYMASSVGDTIEYHLIRRFDDFISTGSNVSTCRDEQQTLKLEYNAFPFRFDTIQVGNFVDFRVSATEQGSNLFIFFPYSSADNTLVFEVDILASQLQAGTYGDFKLDILKEQSISPTITDDVIVVQELDSERNVIKELKWTASLGWLYFKDEILGIEKLRLFQ